MKLSIKKSRSTEKYIIVSYGRIKLAEMIDNITVKITSNLTTSEYYTLVKFCTKRNLIIS